MQVIIAVGDGEVMLRGNERCFEVCEKRSRKNPDTGEQEPYWHPDKWYMTIEQALKAIGNMKLRACDARTLAELQMDIKHINAELKGLYEVMV